MGGDGGHPWEFLFNFSQVAENAFITIKHIFSDVVIGSQNSPSLNQNIIDCYTTNNIHEKITRYSDWLRAMQFKCKTSAKSVTPVQISHRNSGL